MASNSKRRASTRTGLLVVLLVSVAVFVTIAELVVRRAIAISLQRGMVVDIADLYTFGFSYVLVFFLLSTLPLLMVIDYRGLQRDILTAKVSESLAMCGLEDRQLRNRMVEYEERNSLSAFFLPMLVNLNLLFIVWGATMMPEGISGLLDRLHEGDDIRIGIALMFPKVADDATPITWVLLGAYFYTASVMIRRWIQSDLTTNVIWSINVRLVVAFILGLLLMEIVSEQGTAANELDPSVSGLAFLVGIVPDAFLRWVSRQARRVASVDVEDTRLFAPSELQRKIDGMSYWQADRLAEEGVESVQDLAMKEIPSLLIKTRFDTALLMTWVDRALLCNQAGANVELFKRAHIHTASEFIALAGQPEGQTTVLRSLADSQTLLSAEGEIPAPTAGRPTPGDPATAMPITPALLANIASGLENGPNLRHLKSYWANVNGRTAPETHATTVDHPCEPGAGSTGASG